MRRNQPHWLLNDADAKRYGQALSNAMRHMPVRAAQKTIDFGVLAFCIVEMETPRIVMSSKLARQPQPQPQPRGPAQVFQFRTPQANPASPTTAPAAHGTTPADAGAQGRAEAPPILADGPFEDLSGGFGGDPAA